MKQKLIFSTIFIFIVFLSTNFAQETPVTFAPRYESFSVQMPAKPVYYAPTANERDDKRFYKFQQNGKYIVVNCDNNLKSSSYKHIVKFLKNNIVKIIDNKNKRNDGEYLKVLDTEGFYQTILTVNRNNRFYIFHTISREENDVLITDVFDSIKFKPISELARINFEKLARKQDSLINLKENINVNDLDNFKNNKNQSNKETPKKSENGSTNGVKVLSTSQPRYTNIASDYYIDGVVKVKIVFLSNGQIGGITPVTFLPLGLTNLSIQAGREIKFQPARLKGVPYNVRKTVAYNFIIY